MNRWLIKLLILTVAHAVWRGCSSTLVEDGQTRETEPVNDYGFYFTDCVIVSTLMLTLIQLDDVPLLLRRLGRLLVVGMLLQLASLAGEHRPDVTPECGLFLLMDFVLLLKHFAAIGYRTSFAVAFVPLLRPLMMTVSVEFLSTSPATSLVLRTAATVVGCLHLSPTEASSSLIVIRTAIQLLPRLGSLIFICRRLSHGFQTGNDDDQRVLPSVLFPVPLISPLSISFLLCCLFRVFSTSFLLQTSSLPISDHGLIDVLAGVFAEARSSPIAGLGLAACVVRVTRRQWEVTTAYIMHGDSSLFHYPVPELLTVPLAMIAAVLTFCVLHIWPGAGSSESEIPAITVSTFCLILLFTMIARLCGCFPWNIGRCVATFLRTDFATSAVSKCLIGQPIGKNFVLIFTVPASVICLSNYVTHPVARIVDHVLQSHAQHLSVIVKRRIVLVCAKCCEFAVSVVIAVIWMPHVPTVVCAIWALIDVCLWDLTGVICTGVIRFIRRGLLALCLTWTMSKLATPGVDDPRLVDICGICHGDLQDPQQQQQQPSPDERRVVLTPCGHVFHRDCMLSWFAVQLACPMCRRDFTLPVINDVLAKLDSVTGP